MVDISDRIEEIRKLVDAGKYFTINRARQYGKTTTLSMLERSISDDYKVLSLDFQRISASNFVSEELFVKALCRLLLNKRDIDVPDSIALKLEEFVARTEHAAMLDELFYAIQDWCEQSDKPIVLMIDEVDSATNNQVFLDFLAQLRLDYLEKESRPDHPAFQSVILAGVTDVRHLRSRIREDEQHKVNSPWNIATDFNIDMNLSENGIRGMLDEYEADHDTGMDSGHMAKLIYDFTSGYPFLVSRICQIIDEKLVPGVYKSLSEAWTDNGMDAAVKRILSESNTLFDSLSGKVNNDRELHDLLYRILIEGETIAYNQLNESILQMEMYGFIKNDSSRVVISNRIYETLLYNLFISEEEIGGNRFIKEGGADKNIFIKDGVLDMPLILEHFIKTYHQIFGPLEDKFKEKDGRELFLLYLRPIINGTGNYYIEAQTRDQRRTDIVVDYLGRQYVIELKIWRGDRYNESGEKQISDYLDYFGLDIGYMLSFNFNKKKEVGVKKVQIGDRTVYEAVL